MNLIKTYTAWKAVTVLSDQTSLYAVLGTVSGASNIICNDSNIIRGAFNILHSNFIILHGAFIDMWC